MNITMPRHPTSPPGRAMSIVERMFSPNGLLVRSGREYRPGQHEFARTVAECLAEKKSGLCEASTGTGKSFGLLAPAVAAVSTGTPETRIVIAVATNALIEQLRADLPIVMKTLGIEVPFAVVKGRAHSVCQHRLAKTRKHYVGGQWFGRGRMNETDVQLLGGVLRWTENEDNCDLTLHEATLTSRVRNLITIDSKGCRRARDNGCAWAGVKNHETGEEIEPCRCSFMLSRAGAFSAKIVITNFDVLLWNYKFDGGMIGKFSTVILDEAHEWNEKVRDFFSVDYTLATFTHLIDTANDTPNLPNIRSVTNRLGDSLLELEGAIGDFARVPDWHRDPYFETLLDPVGAERTNMAAIVSKMLGICNEIVQLATNARVSEERMEDLDQRPPLKRLLEALSGTENQSNFAISLSVGPIGGDCVTRLTVVPVHLGGYMKQTIHYSSTRESALFTAGNDAAAVAEILREQSNSADSDANVICVSATLTPDGTWTHPKSQFSMPGDTVTCRVDSPFDFERNGLWYIPRAMPSSSARGASREERQAAQQLYTDAAVIKAQQLVQIAGGRTLILCSRRADMQTAKNAISGLGFNVFMQDEAPARELTRRFKEDPTSCLIGSRTFGTGFDVPGGALECVIVWSLPYPHPGPVDELLKQRLGASKWLNLVYTPAMLLAYRQWIGRAIRTTKDIGVIAMLDAGKYSTLGRALTGAMPKGIRLVREIADVDAFLKGHRNEQP